MESQGNSCHGTDTWPSLFAAETVHTDKGDVQGTQSSDSKVQIFEGIPFAAPPVGELRWKAPQPAAAWSGIRPANEFGARCMQGHIYGDMVFRDNGPSEDCLYLNVWTPAASADAHLPVMVWIYGGGFAAGAASEPRQDGTELAKKGVVVVSLNYRLGIFGFFKPSRFGQGIRSQCVRQLWIAGSGRRSGWVKKNIAAFGGDPNSVTIFGKSAGSFSVSALMASPLAQGLFQRAIGESGAFFGKTLAAKSLSDSEDEYTKWAKAALGTDSLEALRGKSADELLQATLKEKNRVYFAPNIDGYFLPGRRVLYLQERKAGSCSAAGRMECGRGKLPHGLR